jgi:Cof subfamily protein (haloacid dehalogenase superfamily)
MYKLIALDIDGTLLNSDKTISDENKAAISAARAKGVQVVLVSGRPTSGMINSLEALGMMSDEDYVLSFNASVVQRVKSKTIIRSQILTGKEAKQLAKLAEKLNVYVHAFSHTKGLITNAHNDQTDRESRINGEPISLIDFETLEDDENIFKVMLVHHEPQLTAAINQLPAELYEQFTIVQSAPYFLEFLNKQSNKGIGVKALADYLSIPAEQVICMGDAGNDFHMIQYAGLGVAMGNATDDIKAIADHITVSNDEHGVAKVIEQYVLNV